MSRKVARGYLIKNKFPLEPIFINFMLFSKFEFKVCPEYLRFKRVIQIRLLRVKVTLYNGHVILYFKLLDRRMYLTTL